jgi:hypothetical protein
MGAKKHMPFCVWVALFASLVVKAIFAIGYKEFWRFRLWLFQPLVQYAVGSFHDWAFRPLAVEAFGPFPPWR